MSARAARAAAESHFWSTVAMSLPASPPSPPPAPAAAATAIAAPPSLLALNGIAADKIRAAVAANVSESDPESAKDFIKRVQGLFPSLPEDALREHTNGLDPDELKSFASRCGVKVENVHSSALLIDATCQILVAGGILISRLAKAPSFVSADVDEDVTFPDLPNRTDTPDAVVRAAKLASEKILAFVKGESSEAPAAAQHLYSLEISRELKKAAAGSFVTDAKVYPAGAVVDSVLNPMYAIGYGQPKRLNNKIVHVRDSLSGAQVDMRVTNVIVTKRSGSMEIILRGTTLPVAGAPAFPVDEGTKAHCVLLDKTFNIMPGQKSVNVMIRTDSDTIGGIVRVAAASSKDLKAALSLSADFDKAATHLGMVLAKQGGGGQSACAPMAIMQMLLNKFNPASSANVLEGAILLRKCAAEFMMNPDVLFFKFMKYLNMVPTGVPAIVLQTAAVHVISKLAEMNQVDAKLWAAFKVPYKAMFRSDISLQDDFVASVGVIARNHAESWDDSAGLGPVEIAAHAVVRMKKEFDPQVQSGARTIDVMALLVSSAGLLNIALVQPHDEYARISFCMGTRMDLDTGLMMWKESTSGVAGHWEAATSVNYAALEFVSESHQRLLGNFSAMWLGMLKGGKVVSASPPKDAQFASSPAAAKHFAERDAAKAQQAADKAAADAAAAKDADASGFVIVGSNKRAPNQKQNGADKQAAAKQAASEENKEAALDRDATKDTVRQFINERFKRSPEVAQRMRNLVARAYSVGSTPSVVRHALRTGSCVYGTVCPRNGCDKAHKKVPAAASVSQPPPTAPTQHARSPQQNGGQSREITLRVDDGGSGGAISFANVVARSAQAAASQQIAQQQSQLLLDEVQQLRQMNMVLQQQQRLQQPQPLAAITSPPRPPSGIAGGGRLTEQKLSAIIANAVVLAMQLQDQE